MQDIDIALDNLLGREFADRINEYLKAHVSLFGSMCVVILQQYHFGRGQQTRVAFMLYGPNMARTAALPPLNLITMRFCMQGEETHHVAVITSALCARPSAHVFCASICRARRRTMWR